MGLQVGVDADGRPVYAWEIPRRDLWLLMVHQAIGDLAGLAYSAAGAFDEFAAAYRRAGGTDPEHRG